MTEHFILHSRYDNIDISTMAVLPMGEIQAIVQLVHGMQGCKERFIPFMEYLAGKGIACIINDHRGHGESVIAEADRGYMYESGYIGLIDDMKLVNEWIHSNFPDIKVFMIGHSMGSLAGRTYLKDYDNTLSGLVLCGNPSHPFYSEPGLKLMRMLEKIAGDRIRMRRLQDYASDRFNRTFADEGRNAWICSDPQARKAFDENRSCDFTFTINGYLVLLDLMHETYSQKGWHLTNPLMPIHFISGKDDPCMINERRFHSSAQMLATVGYKNVTSAIYSGMRHEVLNEIGKETVWEEILQIIMSQIHNTPANNRAA